MDTREERMNRLIRRLVIIGVAVALAPSCGGSGGGGGSPPVALTLNVVVGGSLGKASDVDTWTFAATAGDLIAVDLYARRFDQAGW
jgi:hypothetical protein